MDDFSIQVGLTCPTCGCTQFESEIPESGKDYTDDWLFTCAHCDRTLTRAELLEANEESINAAVADAEDDIIDAVTKELKRTFRKQSWKIK